MCPRALVKAGRSGLTLSRQKQDTRQSAPAAGRLPGAIGWDLCTSMGRMSAMTCRSLAALSVHAEGLVETALMFHQLTLKQLFHFHCLLVLVVGLQSFVCLFAFHTSVPLVCTRAAGTGSSPDYIFHRPGASASAPAG